MSVEVRQEDRDRAADLMEDQKALWHDAIQDIRDGKNDSSPIVQAFAAHRHQAEEAIIRAADKWLATQYGLRPLSADLAAIRSIDTRGE